MNAMLPVSTRIYSGFLALYPAELRRDFGAEMTQVFVEDLEDSYRSRGLAGAARVWRRSVKELWRVALPEHVAKREIAVPIVVYSLHNVYMCAILLMCPEVHGGRGVLPVAQAIAGSLAFSPIPALIAFVALRVGNHSVPVPLVLALK